MSSSLLDRLSLAWASKAVAFLVLTLILKLLYDGYVARRRITRLKAMGIPIAEPWSPLFGHLLMLKNLGKEKMAPDAHMTYRWRELALNWQNHFPNAKKCPPVIYLDMWPIVNNMMMFVVDPNLCAQFTQVTSLPKHSSFAFSLYPLTGGKDLVSMDEAMHKIWRARLNPGFSSKNLMACMPVLIDIMELFTKQLKDGAGKKGEWGRFSPLLDRTMGLAFDVITRTALDLNVHDLEHGPSELRLAMRDQFKYVALDTLYHKLERMTPRFKRDTARNNKRMADVLLPHIQSSVAGLSSATHASGSLGQKTIVNLALKEYIREQEQDGKAPSTADDAEFIETVLGQLKLFVSAGHETTALAICLLFLYVHRSREILSRLRQEHDAVLGTTIPVSEVLLADPQKANELPYTLAVVKEVLRLETVASTFRQGSKSFSLVDPDNPRLRYPTENCLVRSGKDMMNYRDDIWPRPTEFLPERFLVDEGHELFPVKGAWRPFELGPSACIAKELAMMEMKLALVFGLRELEFDFDGEEWDRQRGAAGQKPALMDGQRWYRAGDGASIGNVKDGLPARVRVRSL